MNFESFPVGRPSYRFNEVTSVTGVKPYVLRFWESEFDQINPAQSEAGHKVYSKEDIVIIEKIKKLLFEDKLSIPQAKSVFDTQAQAEETTTAVSLSSRVTLHKSSLDMMKSALASDFQAQEVIQEPLVTKSFNDGDVLNLVQAKKKLSVVLAKANSIIAQNNWP